MNDHTGPVPVTTADGLWSVGVAGSETVRETTSNFALPNGANGNLDQRVIFEFPPAHAREVARMLAESAEGVGSDTLTAQNLGVPATPKTTVEVVSAAS